MGSSGKLAEPNVPGQCEGSLAGDAPWSLCKDMYTSEKPSPTRYLASTPGLDYMRRSFQS